MDAKRLSSAKSCSSVQSLFWTVWFVSPQRELGELQGVLSKLILLSFLNILSPVSLFILVVSLTHVLPLPCRWYHSSARFQDFLFSTDVRDRQHTKASLHNCRNPGPQLIMSAELPLLLQDKKIFLQTAASVSTYCNRTHIKRIF